MPATPATTALTWPRVARRALLLALWSSGAPSTSAAEFHVATLDDALARQAQPLIERAYARLGHTVKFTALPLKRATHLLQQGQLDAEMIRSESYFAVTPETLKVPVPVTLTRFMVYQRPPCPDQVSRATLASAGVLYLRGVRAVEDELPRQSLLPVGRDADLLPLLVAGRARYVLAATSDGQLPVAPSLADKVCRVPEPFMTRPLFHALHRRHAALLAPLTEALSAESAPP